MSTVSTRRTAIIIGGFVAFNSIALLTLRYKVEITLLEYFVFTPAMFGNYLVNLPLLAITILSTVYFATRFLFGDKKRKSLIIALCLNMAIYVLPLLFGTMFDYSGPSV